MTTKNASIIELEKHATKDIHDSHTNGDLTVIWRDWDNIIKKTPKMVYVSSVNPGEIKGPHLHKNRTSYFSCIHGKVVFIIQDKAGNFEEIEVSSEKPVLICVPNGIASAHLNLGKDLARILVLADVAWKPDDNEMIDVEFSNYNFNKWK
jgi:dTDP-4-dehydrorhamnose 3,5-epimerase